jgi:hypothetical protein
MIQPDTKAVVNRDWDEFWRKHGADTSVIEGHSSQVACEACGAVVLMDDKVATDRCGFCGAHLVNQPVAAQGMIPVGSVVPFAIAENQAVEAFNGWIATRWFAPGTLNEFANLGKLTGMYVPYWTYDSMTYSRYFGERGDHYTVTETYTEKDAQGNDVVKTRQVTHTNWTSVSGQIQHFFEAVLVCASRSLPPGLVRWLESWNLKKLERFRPEFLSSFQTERYAIGLKEGFDRAKAIMDGHIRQLCCRAIGGDEQRIQSVQTQHVGITFQHVLLPVWVAAYRYKNTAYQILVNGQTGQVTGNRPYSVAKILLLAGAVILAIVLGIVVVSIANK